MAVMIALMPPAKVERGGVEFTALEAARDTRGLCANVRAINGHILHTDTIHLGTAKDRKAFALMVDCLPADDVDAALVELQSAVEIRLREKHTADEARHTGRGAGDGESTYAIIGGRMCWNRPTPEGGTTVIPLANFSARIIEEVVTDDGAERRGEFVIAGELMDGTPLPQTRVPFAHFSGMKWVVGAWGGRAVIAAGNSTADRLREAIQLHSAAAIQRTEYAHTGWRLVDGQYLYLTASGAITATGTVVGVDVALSRSLQRASLPEPPQGDRLCEAIRASLAVADVAPDRISIPFLSGVYHAPLQEITPTDITLHIAGHTGTYKSEYATLGQQHFGATFSRLTLPAQWASTANALERMAFEAKDLFFVVDDFAPSGTANEINRYHMTAERFVRSVGNGAGRSRMSADGRLRPDLPPRCLPCSTGEEIPRGQSLRARLTIIEVGPGDIDLARLTDAQIAGAEGKYAEAMAGYVRWIAQRMDDLKAHAPGSIARIRDMAQKVANVHARTPEAVAHFVYAWECWLTYATDSGAMTETEHDAWLSRIWSGLGDMAQSQGAHQRAEDVVKRFLELVSAAIASGQAHLASRRGDEPEDPDAWGWRQQEVGTGEYTRDEWRPQGMRIGWVDDESMYLLPDAAYQVVNRIAMTNSTPLPITVKTLAKRLQERNVLQSTDVERHTIRIMAEGRRQRVLHLHESAFATDESEDEE